MESAPNSELVRTITYLSLFALGVFALGAAIWVILTDSSNTELFGVLVTFGLALVGGNAVATYNVPSVKPKKVESSITPVSAVVADSDLLDRANTGSMEAVPIDPIEMTQNADSPRRGEPGVVYKPGGTHPKANASWVNPDYIDQGLSASLSKPGKYGKHE